MPELGEYELKELEVIELVGKLEDTIEDLNQTLERISEFVEKLNQRADKTKIIRSTLRKSVDKNIEEGQVLIFFYKNVVQAMYEYIIDANDMARLDSISNEVEQEINFLNFRRDILEFRFMRFKKQLTSAEMVELEDNPRNLPVNKNLSRVKYSTSENFVTETGLKMRRTFLGALKNVLKSASRRKTVVENYPRLEKNETYIFVPNHLFDEETNSLTIALDRNAFILIGSTDQIEHNPVLNGLWLSGMVYVNRLDKESRKDSVRKMERLLNSGTSVIAYAEGQYNNTENKLAEDMFYSPYELWKSTGKKVVPVSTYTSPELDTVYVRFGEPLSFIGMNKEEAIDLLRDKVAEMHYQQIEEHSVPLTREYLDSREDYHLDYMIQRREEYLHHPWYNDVWDEELNGFIKKGVTSPQEVRASFDNVVITPENAHIFAPILVRREEDKKYDFKQFMKDTWDKDIRELYPDNDILDYEYQKGNARKRVN